MQGLCNSLLAAALIFTASTAQAFPDRPVRLVLASRPAARPT
jgi:hypothetical protein